MMVKSAFTISLLLVYAPIAATTSTPTTSNSTESSGMSSVSTVSPSKINSGTATMTHLRSSLDPETKTSKLISKTTLESDMTTLESNMTSRPSINTSAKTATDGGTAFDLMLNTHFLCYVVLLFFWVSSG